MAVKWTTEQCNAIDAKNRAVVVSAAAGSGKTAVLVEKLLRLLSDRENPVSADRIAVVTFTNDAAAQMKQRLTAALAAASELDPENDWLISQQALIPSAKISTIHSFCFNLIRENAGKLDIDSGFRVLDEPENDVIFRTAAENVFESGYENRTDVMRAITDCFCPGAKDSESMYEYILMLRNSIMALPFPERFMEKTIHRYENPPELCDDELAKIYTEYVIAQLNRACKGEKKYHAMLCDIYGREGMKIDKIKKLLDQARLEFETVENAAREISQDSGKIFTGDIKISFEKITQYSSGSYTDSEKNKIKCEFDKELLDAAKNLRDSCRKICTECLNEFTEEDIRSDYIQHAKMCSLLFELLRDVFAEARRLRYEKNSLNFSDAEQLACELLCSCGENGEIVKTQLAQELSERFDIVMIDEFQDSTAVQELIFKMISRDGTADTAGSNFFAVGDVKQSIYRFRCADPRIFLKNITDSVPYADDGMTTPAHILLNRNFRSSQSVVDFVNTVFTDIMSEKNGGIDYGASDCLIKGSDALDELGVTEILDLPENAEDDAEVLSMLEAACVARRIRDILDNGTITVNGVTRKVLPSDICILSRKAKPHAHYINSLEQLGIHASGCENESYISSREISILINLLRIIDNPTLDIPMAAVMMSPMFMFTAEDMARIRLSRSTSLYADVLGMCSSEDVTLRVKCEEFIRTLGELREYSASHCIEELIGRIYDKTDFMAVISVYKDSLRKKANLRLLPIYAAGYDKNGSGGLGGFIRQIDAMLRNEKDFAAASATVDSEQAVTIKTIHKSKGLEFPIVFICDSWSEFNLSDKNSRLVFDSDFGVAFRIGSSQKHSVYETFPRRVFSFIKEKALRDEEMMLLYVALTRAKNKLIITRRTDEKAQKRREHILSLLETAGKQDEAINAGNCMADWLDAAVGMFDDQNGSFARGDCSIVFTEGKASDEEACEKEIITAEYDDAAAERFREMLADDYDYALSQTSAKVTVSELAKKHEPVQRIFEGKISDSEHRVKGISAAAAGTAVHAFMEHADLKKLYDCRDDGLEEVIATEKERICRCGLMTELETECVQTETVRRFLCDDICRRMMISPNIYREKKFLVKICELNLDDSDLMVYNNTEGMLQGIADCVFEENGSYVLVDYKTDRRVTAQALTERYARQLRLYAHALNLILDKPVTAAYLYSFSLGQSVKTEI